MKKTNVLNHSSKNWLVAFVAICGFMFMGAFSVSAQSYVDAETAKERVAGYQQEQAKLATTSGRPGNLTVQRADLTQEDLMEYARVQVAKSFFSALSGMTSQDVANTLSLMRTRYAGIQNGSALNAALLAAHNEFDHFLRN